MAKRDINDLFHRMISGDRVALGQVMTLVESDLPEDRSDAIDILTRCEQKLKDHDPSTRFAISGAPGVGKSTFIEALGDEIIRSGKKVGVITIDPSSSQSRGSILGDKSRMTSLSSSPFAFVRSSSAGDVLGGLGRRSMELMTLLSACKYDIILLETVGVGQSEHVIWQFTDGFILIIQPGAGDELQGIKRGITELADIVVINKADGNLSKLAEISKSQYSGALHYFSATRDGWLPKMTICSSQEKRGIDDVWAVLRLYMEYLDHNESRQEHRIKQKLNWLNWSLTLAAQQLLIRHPVINQNITNAQETIQTDPSSVFRMEFDIEKKMTDLLNPSYYTK